MQKVKHLEYEHQNSLKSIAMDGDNLLGGESDLHRSGRDGYVAQEAHAITTVSSMEGLDGGAQQTRAD